MSVKDDLIGGKGGGSSTFRSTPDNLRSTDTFEALLGLCSGRIRGLAPGGLQNLFVDDVPIQDGSGNTTLKDFNAVLFDGDPAVLRPVTLQLGGSSGPSTINLAVNNANQATGTGSPGDWRYGSVTQSGVDYIDLRFIVNSLYRQDKNGIYDTTASLEIEFQPSGSSQWINPLSSTAAPTYNANGIGISTGFKLYALEDYWATDTTWYDPSPGLLPITGKTTQAYVKELRVAVPNTGNYVNKTWQVRVRLRERDSYTNNQDAESRAITWESVAGVSMAPLGNNEDWRGLAYLQINGKASDQLSGIPTITGIYDLSMVRVPPSSVWNAETRAYTGATWDGATEEIQWTQCPAFQMKDLIEDDISGISALVPGSTLNKWDALEASKWYAQLVPDGKGGTHSRYSMNYMLDSAQSVNDLMQYVAGAVGSYAWDEGDGNWRLVVEKPENATALFTKESIVGEFNYSNTDIDTRYNDIIGVFRNEERGFQEDRVRVFDQTHIDNYGRRATSIALVGCTNRQEALRRIKIRQLSSLNETRQVSFVTNRQGNMVQPFSVVLVADGDLASDTTLRTTGRLVGRTSGSLTVRDTLRLEVGITYKVHVTIPNPDYNPATTSQPTSADWKKPTITISRNVTNTAGQRGDTKTLYIDSALPASTPDNAQIALEAVGLPTLPKQYRVIDVEPQDKELVAITAIEIYTNKWNESDAVNEADILSQVPHKIIPSPLTPADGNMFGVKIFTAQFQSKRVFTVRWDRPSSIWIDGFRVEYNLNDGPWQTFTDKTQDSYVELQQPENGVYNFRITTLDRRGGASAPLLGIYTLTDRAEDYAPVQIIGHLASRPAAGNREGDRYTTDDQSPNRTYVWTNNQWIEESNLVKTAAQVPYSTNETLESLKPAEPGATNSALPSSAFGNSTVGQVLATAAAADASARQMKAGVSEIEEALMRAVLETDRNRSVLRDAGVVVDPVAGTVRIYGVDQNAEQVSNVQLLLNAQAGTLALKADVNYVNQQILAAQLGGATADLSAIFLRLTSAEVNIDALKASVALKADATTVSGLAGTVTSVSQTLDALSGVVATKASSTTVDQIATRVGSVEQTINSLGNVVGLTVDIHQARYVADTAAESALRALLAGDTTATRQLQQSADIRQELYTKIIDGDSALAISTLALSARTDLLAAGLVTTQQALATTNLAVASSVTTLTARLDGAGGTGVSVEQAFNAQADRLGDLEGQYVLSITSDGRWQGFKLAGSTSGPATFSLIDTDLAMGTGRVVFANAQTMLVQGVGFGANSDLIEWYGPTQAVSTCTKANAVFARGTDAKVYSGGQTLSDAITSAATAAAGTIGSSAVKKQASGNTQVNNTGGWFIVSGFSMTGVPSTPFIDVNVEGLISGVTQGFSINYRVRESQGGADHILLGPTSASVGPGDPQEDFTTTTSLIGSYSGTVSYYLEAQRSGGALSDTVSGTLTISATKQG